MRYKSRIAREAKAPKKAAKKGGAVSGGAISTGGALKTGGALTTGGRVKSVGDINVDTLDYPQIVHTLGHMSGDEFHSLQGLAAGHLPNVMHPLKNVYMKAYGGGFVHPAKISKVATKDITLAHSPQALSKMLYGEWMDHQSGKDVRGSGLLASLKNVLKKGVTGLHKGSKVAINVATKLQKALKRGTDIAKSFQAPLEAAFPAAGEVLSKAVEASESAQKGLGVGISAGTKLQEGIGEIKTAIE